MTTQQDQNAAFDPATCAVDYPRLASASPLDAQTLERHFTAHGNARLQGLAQRVAAARSRLLDLQGADEALSMAEDARHFTGADPERWLLDELTEVQAEIADAEAGRKRREARRLARSKRTAPLHFAVGQRHAALVRERDVLRERVYMLKKGTGAGDHSPLQFLKMAGLTSEQIAAVGEVRPGELDRVRYTDRLAVIEPEIAAFDAWIASGYRDHQHLAGLGFDALVAAAQPVDETEVPR